MRRRSVQAALIAMLVLAGAMTSLQPAALALDEELTTCTWEAFSNALAAIQDAGGGTLTLTCSGTIVFEDELTITTDIAIIGVGDVILDGNDHSTRFFTVDEGASLELVGLTLQHGDASFGGAILGNPGATLAITASTFSDNEATTDGGAIYIYDGTLTIASSEFNGNMANDGGAILNLSSTLEVTASTFDDNEAESEGGAIHSWEGSLAITASSFTGNEAGEDGGAIYNYHTTLDVTASTFETNETDSDGGAIINFASTVTITASSFTGNRAVGEGGAIHNAHDPQAVELSFVSITASTFDGNEAGGNGGALYNEVDTVTITASTFSDNETTGSNGYGGAIYNAASPDSDPNIVSITASTFSGNETVAWGGAISNFDTLEVTASTFNGNTAQDAGAIHTGATATITSSTFSGNSADSELGSVAGAIYNNGTLALIASTLSDNSANGSTGQGGGIYSIATLELTASIIANNSAAFGPNCRGAVPLSGGWNLSNDSSCSLGADDIQNSTAINLGELADNGGPTLTMLPLDGSDARDNALCSATTATDQRGAERPTADEDCDRGAVEVEASVPVTLVAFVATSATHDLAEGDSVSLRAVASGPDNSNLRYTLDCDGDGLFETEVEDTGTSVDISCLLPDDGDILISLQVCDGDDDTNCETASLPDPISVANLPPVITGITAQVSQQGLALITVTASDPGVNDVLSYAFDCDNDGSYELAGNGNQGNCQLDPSLASATVGVQVSDDDLGVATDVVTVSQSATLCGNRSTGALSAPGADGTCPPGTLALTVPAPAPMTFCVNPYTGALIWSPRGTCGAGYRVHIVPDNGPLHFCQNIYTGKLRYTANGTCSAGERAGVIPG